ncbi:ribosomal protein S18-alanine N-acetyltransferase [Williamsia muralis]|uniref:Ribosomal-protein-alanine N-acetyltransferase n=1 Tax=Williamsia marianensis TaxID=85044 RepID=A0A2G3PSN7_WILMA|nr:ribosomal protein S18-alanine N-acetyltransferase [Williamsia marianensis]PHV68771.1 ribosomal-protein-alanine N-acetyltransferase [Williamsia marianensis]PZT95376.1 MAG: ribosomal-protein-alanine N-acetyltransferase [Gordonia sp. (in: high G+C Gram-positive bacteria)]
MTSSKVEIGPLLPRDASRCAAIESLLFAGDSPWPAQAFRAEISTPHNHYFAARDGDDLIGYAGISVLGPAGDHECEIHTIAVAPEHQGHGHGRELLAALLEIADKRRAPVFLEVRTDNEAAINLYRRNGFEIVGIRKGYYQPSGADAYTMRREQRSAPPEGGRP